MSTSGAPPPVPELDLRPRDTEIVVAVFRTIFLLVVLLSPQFLQAQREGGALLAAAVISAALYNLSLFVLHVRGYPFPRIIIVMVDVILISLWIYFCKWPDSSGFYSLYFAVVIVASLWYGMSGASLSAIFASVLYLWAVLTSLPPGTPNPTATVAVQVGFLIITAGVVSFAAQAQERERQALATSRAVLQQYRERIRVAQYVDDLVRPKRLPTAPGLDIGFQYRPAAMAFSGDYYDLIPLGGRRWGLCVADLSGHFSQRIGYLSTFKTTLRLTARREQSPARVLTELNREVSAAVADNVELETFISVAYLLVDLDEATFTYANAGHEPPVLIPAESREPVTLARAGLVLGVLPEVRYPEETLPLRTGDTFVLFSDGMTEVMDRLGRFLGREGFLNEALTHLQAPTAEEMAERIFNAVNEFGRGGQHRDDMTLLIARVTAADLGTSHEFVPA
jgi:serine phosphatase RsbU (regulator of sigma subunit)